MTIDEAIKILEDDSIPPELRVTTDYCKAVQLGIEALKRHKAQECCQANVIVGPLPGETKD